MAARSKAWVCGRSLAGIACSMFVSCECCVDELRSLCRADHSPRGVLPSVMCPLIVIVKPRKGEAMTWNQLLSTIHVTTYCL